MKRIFGIWVFLICIASTPAFAQRHTIFPEFMSGDGWASEFFFTNQDFVKVSEIKISFYDGIGNPASVSSNLGNDTSYTFDLDPGATQVIRIIPQVDLLQGYAIVHYPRTDAPIRATEVFRFLTNEGKVSVEIGVPQQEYGNHYSFPAEVISSEGIATNVAIVTPEIYSSKDQIILFTLFNSDGTIKATAERRMQSGDHMAAYLQGAELFPGLDNFTGSISISSPLGVGVLALRQDREGFGAIATDGGPILAPFALDGRKAPEEEPNDTKEQASPLGGFSLKSGTISSAEDLDYFVFDGMRDTIISVICDAQLDGSKLDSVLEIYNSNMELIARNNQNGMSPGFPVKDSFMQMKLPNQDDTYYLKITGSGGGGSEYHYTLHVKIP